MHRSLTTLAVSAGILVLLAGTHGCSESKHAASRTTADAPRPAYPVAAKVLSASSSTDPFGGVPPDRRWKPEF